MTSGAETITSGLRKPWKLTLNVSPYRRRQSSRNRIGRATQRAVCAIGDSVGPAGSALTFRPYAVLRGGGRQRGRQDDLADIALLELDQVVDLLRDPRGSRAFRLVGLCRRLPVRHRDE